MLNPFNGIERDYVPLVALNIYFNYVNPFNGIESYSP